MAYVKATDFAAKDALLSGNPSKVVKGTEIDDEFNAIATSDALTVKGPSSATDNAIARFDSTTGKLVQNSSVTVSDAGVVAGASVNLGSNTVTGTTAQFNTALSDGDFATLAGAETLSNKTVSLTSNTVSGTAAEFDSACSDDNFVYQSDIGTDVQAYDADTAKTDVAQTFTASQRGTITTDNDGSFDLNVTNNFFCTPTGNVTLTFTNIAAGQSGFIKLVNGSNYTISAAGATKIKSSSLTAISATGTYLLGYFSDGTNVYVTASSDLT